jgi:polyhydroxybutyrate depolymerase
MKSPTSFLKRSFAPHLLILPLICAGLLWPNLASAAPSTQAEQRRLTSGGQVREYLFQPAPNKQRNSPLVIVLHGGEMSADIAKDREYGGLWSDRAAKNGFALAFPQGKLNDGSDRKHNWNDCRAVSVRQGDGGLHADEPSYSTWNDVQFIRDMIAEVQQRDGIDPSRIYAVGGSNGGMMTFRLAAEAGDLFAGFAPLIAADVVLSECQEPSVQRPIIFTYGTADTLMPPAGGCIADRDKTCSKGAAKSAQATIQHWANFLQARPGQEVAIADINTKDESQQFQRDFTNANQQVMLRVVRIENGGHSEPSDRQSRLLSRIPGFRANADRPAVDYISEFFGLTAATTTTAPSTDDPAAGADSSNEPRRRLFRHRQ